MTLSYQSLISTNLTRHTRNVLANDNSEELTFYFENNQKKISIDYYSYIDNREFVDYNNFSIISVGHSQADLENYRSILNRLDNLIDLDFKEFDHNNGSDIDIYSVSYSSNWDPATIGQALAQTSGVGSWWDIFWMDTDGKNSTNNNDTNTFIHEIGHSLGLAHPNEDPYDISYTTADTVMSYNPSNSGFNEWFSDIDILALQSIWGRENDDGNININGLSKNYKFKKSDDKYYLITSNRDEDITHLNQIVFSDNTMNVKNEIIKVFDLVTGIDNITGQIFRLYNSALGRFPDHEGFNYWINMNKSGANSYRQTASSFLISAEFNELYGESLSTHDYVNTLYKNILDREPDLPGQSYWIGRLENNLETRSEVLMGFSESVENKAIFSSLTDYI